MFRFSDALLKKMENHHYTDDSNCGTPLASSPSGRAIEVAAGIGIFPFTTKTLRRRIHCIDYKSGVFS